METEKPRRARFNKKRMGIYLLVALLGVAVFLIPTLGFERIRDSLAFFGNRDREILSQYGSYLNYYLQQRRQSQATGLSKYTVDGALEKIREIDASEFNSPGDSNPYLEQAVADDDLELLKVLSDKIHFEDGNYCVHAILRGLKNPDQSMQAVNYLLNHVIGCREKGLFQLACQGDLKGFHRLFDAGPPNLMIQNADGLDLSSKARQCGQDAMVQELAKLGAPVPPEMNVRLGNQ